MFFLFLLVCALSLFRLCMRARVCMCTHIYKGQCLIRCYLPHFWVRVFYWTLSSPVHLGWILLLLPQFRMCAWYILRVSEIQTHFLMLGWQAVCVYTKFLFCVEYVYGVGVYVFTYILRGQRLCWLFSLIFKTGSLFDIVMHFRVCIFTQFLLW